MCLSNQCYSLHNRTTECQAGPIYKCPYYPCHMDIQCYQGYCDHFHGYCSPDSPYINYTDPTCYGNCPTQPCTFDSDCGSGRCIYQDDNSSYGICSGSPPDECLTQTSDPSSPNYNARYDRCDYELCTRDSECSSFNCDPNQWICLESQWSYNQTNPVVDPQEQGNSDGSNNTLWIVLGSVLGGLFIFTVVATFMIRRKRLRKVLEELEKDPQTIDETPTPNSPLIL